MTKHKNLPGFKGHRFPPEIIEYVVWLYFRFSLSLRDVEDLLAACGVTNSMGVWFQYAVFLEATRLAIPGPFWVMAILIFPEAREYLSAIIPLVSSCAQSQKLNPAAEKLF